MTLGANQIAAYAASLLDTEDDIGKLQDAKGDLYKAIREEHGKAEANALKLAVKLSRMKPEKISEAEAIDTEAQRMLAIIEKAGRAPRATRVENIEENPPIAAVEKKPSRLAHNQKIAGASPAPATSVEAQQEGAADGESPSPRPVGEPGPNAGGENVATHDVDPATTAIGEDGVRADALALGSDVEAVAPAPDKQWGFKDKPHHDCQNPTQCGGFSNLALCEQRKQAAA